MVNEGREKKRNGGKRKCREGDAIGKRRQEERAGKK